jgi:hypothetical protein
LEGDPVQEYEILAAGPIGPAVASSLPPGFTFLRVPSGTILAGTVGSPEDLLSVIDLLDGHGLALTDLWISHGDHAGEPVPVGQRSVCPPVTASQLTSPLGR